MICHACGSPLDPSGVFPGGRVRCACGAESVVSASPPLAPVSAGPYRKGTGSSHEPIAPVAPADPRSHCPACSRPLDECVRDGYPMWLCGAGHGLFVETSVLSRLLDEAKQSGAQPDTASRLALAGSGPVRYVPCPVCAKTMARRNFGRVSGIIVDVCASHGTWFDAGELDQAVAFASTGRMQRDSEKDAERPSVDLDRALLDARIAENEAVRRDQRMAESTVEVLDEGLDIVRWLIGMPTRPRWWRR